MPEQPDHNKAGDLFQKSMEEALAHLESVRENLLKEQEKAIDAQIAAREEFNRIERDAHKISEAYMDKHRNEIEQRLRDEILLDVTRKLILAEVPSNLLKSYLDLSPQLLADAWLYLGFEKMDEHHVGHVAYQSEGRSGKVIFYREDRTLRFYYEFGGGDAIAIIWIPTAEKWEAETGMKLEERMQIVEFVANRVVRDQTSDGHYTITADTILIKK